MNVTRILLAVPLFTSATLADEALVNVQDVQNEELPTILSLGRSMPPKPLLGQRRPPCGRGEREINGGCWSGPIGDEKPPCGSTMVDYEGRCYKPSVDMPRQPTLEEP